MRTVIVTLAKHRERQMGPTHRGRRTLVTNAVVSLASIANRKLGARGCNIMHATLDTQVLKKAVLLACRAPSVHNSPPWLWVDEGAVLHLFADRYRTVPGADHSGREAIISCGAVLDHLRVATLAAGWHAGIERFPNPNDPDHLASIEFRPVDHV